MGGTRARRGCSGGGRAGPGCAGQCRGRGEACMAGLPPWRSCPPGGGGAAGRASTPVRGSLTGFPSLSPPPSLPPLLSPSLLPHPLPPNPAAPSPPLPSPPLRPRCAARCRPLALASSPSHAAHRAHINGGIFRGGHRPQTHPPRPLQERHSLPRRGPHLLQPRGR